MSLFSRPGSELLRMEPTDDEQLLSQLSWTTNSEMTTDVEQPRVDRFPRNKDTRKPSSRFNSTRNKGKENKTTERPLANYYWDTGETTTHLLANVYILHQSASTNLLSNYVFITQIIELLFSISGLTIALLVLSEYIKINNYAYAIAMAVILLILVSVHIFAISQWQEQPKFSHIHNNEIYFSFFCWLSASFINLALLGIWLLDKNNSSCCSFEDSQPSEMPPYNSEEVQMFGVFAAMLILNAIAIVFACTALISHYYPEARFVSPPPIADTIISSDKTGN